jgi:peptidoglycan hydrolase-like protein with peptidoglycan-binding domain
MQMIRRITITALVAGAAFSLTACGDTAGDRGLSGAGIGAGAGAIIGAATPIGPLAGALIGGVAGGATGVLTTPSQVNLGKPAWRSGSSADGAPAAGASSTVANIQSGLLRLGYEPGPADGRLGPRTQAAIRS